MKHQRTLNMTTGSPIWLLIRFAIPLLIGNLFQQAYSLTDSIIVGQYLGAHALAAVGATDWSYWLILWTVGGLTQGFSTFVSRAFGEKNYRELNKTIAACSLLCLWIGGILTVVGLAAAGPLLKLLTALSLQTLFRKEVVSHA